MKHSHFRYLFAGGLALFSLSIEAAGFKEIKVSDPGHPELAVGLWYPTNAPIPSEPNTVWGLPVAHDAPLHEPNGGLIVISHGFGGWYAGHADTAEALADAGYIVAAPTHTGNTWSDMSSSIDKWLIDRPRHISRVIDDLTQRAQTKDHIDTQKIGVYGFSAGGYTAVSLIGGTLDLNEAAMHCVRHPEEFICAEGAIKGMQASGMGELPASAWGADKRISAASISAPGFGFAFTGDTLASVTAKVQLWSGELDTSVPTSTNAKLLAQRLPEAPETHWVDNANHFAFMVVNCREAFKEADPEEYAMVCNDAEGFNRLEFHDAMHLEMVRFFDSSFGM